MRSRSPTLRKTETQDIYRTFVDLPEGQTAGGVVFSNEQMILSANDDLNQDTLRQVQYSNNQEPMTRETVASPMNDQELITSVRTPAERKTVTIMHDPNDGTSQRTAKKRKMTPAERKTAADMKKRTSDFLNTTRWLPDSSFTTYFGKPAFHAYGKGNVKPTVGGINYGHNMLTHNINAECGDNPPLYQQVYDQALKSGIVKTKGMRVPQIPIIKANVQVTEQTLAEFQARKPIMPKQRRTLGKNSKQVGSKGNIKIAKPTMTLTGFEHTQSNLNLKKKLDTGSIRPDFQDIVSSARRSRSRASGDYYRDDLQNPPSEGKTDRSTTRDGFQALEADEVPPMNEDIRSNDDSVDGDEPMVESGKRYETEDKLACNA